MTILPVLKESPAKRRAKTDFTFYLPGLLAIPVFNVLLDLILGEAITLLDLSFELIAATVYGGEVIVGELAPLLLDLAGNLLPVSFNAIPVHDDLLNRFWGEILRRCWLNSEPCRPTCYD
jgi:hypothetical protein